MPLGFTTRDDGPGSHRGRGRFWRLAFKWALGAMLICLGACKECCPPSSSDAISQFFCDARETPPTPIKTPGIKCDLGSAFGLAVGADGNLWFTEYSGNKIGRVTTSSGTVTEFSIPTTGAGPVGIAAGPDGALWFTESLPTVVTGIAGSMGF